MSEYRPGPRMKLLARIALPLGVLYLLFALASLVWLFATDGLQAIPVLNLIVAIPIALYLIWQGREWRRDPRFR